MKEIYWVVYFSPMASEVGHNLESPETLGGGGWTRVEFPPPAPKGAATVWCLNRLGEGVTSGKLVREMAGDAEGAGPLEFLVPCPHLYTPYETAPGADRILCLYQKRCEWNGP